MTELYNGKVVIKAVRGEAVSECETEIAVNALRDRIEQETQSVTSLFSQPWGPETTYRSAAEQVVDNRRINREDRGEFYLDLDPMASNLPVTHH